MMKCPNCHRLIAPASVNCQSCFAPVQSSGFSSAEPRASLPPQQEIGLPLTGRQKLRLLSDCAIRWVLAGAIGTTAWLIYTNVYLPIWALLFWLVVVLWLLYSSRRALSDYLAGITEVVVAFLESSEADRPLDAPRYEEHDTRRSSTYSGNFTGIGSLSLDKRRVGLRSAGYIYRVVYSPRTRIVWSMEQIGERIANPPTMAEMITRTVGMVKGHWQTVILGYVGILIFVLWSMAAIGATIFVLSY